MSTNTESIALVGDETARNVARAALFAALTGAFAYFSFQLPVTPVPYTLQVLGVFLAGVFLGPVWGFASMALYVVAGAAGAPVYAYGASGVGSLFGNFGGYLWAYPLAAAALGYVAHGRDGLTPTGEIPLWRLAVGLTAATAIVYGLGAAGYALFGNVGLGAAVMAAAVPFVPGELLKAVVAVLAARSDQLRAA